MKYLLLAVSAFLAIIAQMIAGSNFFLFSFLDISLVLISYWAIYRNRIQAIFIGSMTGILLDAALGWPLGYNGFGKTLAAFAVGQASKRFNIGETWIRFTVIVASSGLSSFSMFVLFWLMQRSRNMVFLKGSLVQALVTAGVGVFLFAALDTYNRIQTHKAH